jgi:uroporphyrinogen decarboxylase
VDSSTGSFFRSGEKTDTMGTEGKLQRMNMQLKRREKPDFSRFLRVIRRQGDAGYVPFYEMVIEPSYFEPLSGIKAPEGMNFMPTSPTYEATFAWYLNCCAAMGYDHGIINLSGFGGFPTRRHFVEGTARNFCQDGDAMIASWEGFESYPWPSADALDVDSMERVARLAPEGLGVITGGLGVFQPMCDILGYTGLAMMVYEDPELLKQVTEKVGSTVLKVLGTAASLPFIDGVLVSGDMGFKTGTFLPPQRLRELILPWHKRICEVIDGYGKIAILHSCGNLEAIMEDLIDCGYDAKHSFEDVITPSIFDLNKRYGDRICLLGGVDVDLLCRSDEEGIRRRVRKMIDELGPDGGYVLGSGNSIAEYVPMENYRAMLDEGLRYGRS